MGSRGSPFPFNNDVCIGRFLMLHFLLGTRVDVLCQFFETRHQLIRALEARVFLFQKKAFAGIP
jgi:hypothetical protein